MARATNILLVLAGCMLLATMVAADTSVFKFQFFEHVSESNENQSFGPSSGNKGKGITYVNTATKTWNPSSEVYGTASGLYFYTSDSVVHEVSSIKFKDINEKGGRFADAEIHLRGLWYEEDGEDAANQELAIVGGAKGLRGAYGSVLYTKVGKGTFLVQGIIYIDDATSVAA